jgi:WXXGXW repeat (2 copies)
MRNLIRSLSVSLLLAALPLASEAGVFISVSIAPPALPVYVAPPMPAPGYFWTPGYWAYGGEGYYWVPGTWVVAPAPGLLWTPGYWGWAGGVYAWHGGYWGPHVGFYGGVNYGFGYGGVGFVGGSWVGGHYVANTTVINNTTVVNNTTINRVSYNGGTGGIAARPTAAELHAAQEPHTAPSQMQQDHEQAASRDRTMLASYNHGSPSVAATQKAGVFYGHGVTAAHVGGPSQHAAGGPSQHAAGPAGAAGAHTAPMQYAHTNTPATSHGGGYPGAAPAAHSAYPGAQSHGGAYPAAPGPAHAPQPGSPHQGSRPESAPRGGAGGHEHPR